MAETVYGPSWYAATMLAAPERDRLVYDLDVDACVIGGGLAGLTTARELARRGWSVAVLEASRVAWSASGRNAGIVAPGFSERIDRIIERVGLDHTRALWVLSAGGVDYVRTAIRETQMAGVSPVDGWLMVQRTDSPDRLFRTGELIARSFGFEVEPWSTERVREAVRTPTYFQGLNFPGAFHIHPLNYALGLAAAAEEAGAKIFENTPALEVDAAGVRKRITTADGRVRAAHVIVAGSSHFTNLVPPISNSVLPVTSYMAATAPLGAPLGEAITYQGAVSDTRRAGDYYRIVDGSRLLWGGRLTARQGAPRRLGNLIRSDMLQIFPQLGPVEITHAWTGTMGYAVHKMPQIGEVSRGVWVASAFGGHGINTSAMAGELIARAIAEGDDRWRLFASYDLVDAGGSLGRAISHGLFWYLRAREALDERLEFNREATRRRREARAAQRAEEARIRAEAEAQRKAELEARLEAERQAAAEAERRAAAEAEERARQETQRQAELEAQLEPERLAVDAEQRAREEAQRLGAERAEVAAVEAQPAPVAPTEPPQPATEPLAVEDRAVAMAEPEAVPAPDAALQRAKSARRARPSGNGHKPKHSRQRTEKSRAATEPAEPGQSDD